MRITSKIMLASASLLLAAQAHAIEVQNANGSGPGSLRQAIIDAPAGEIITFAESLEGQTITVGYPWLLLDKNITIQGPGASLLTIQNAGGVRVLEIKNNAHANISGVTISKGNEIDFTGGGILVQGGSRLELRDSVLAQNESRNGGGISIVEGAGALIEGCAFIGNKANNGGAIINAGATIVRNSTFSGNTAFGWGSAIRNYGEVTIDHCTFALSNPDSINGAHSVLRNDPGARMLISNSVIGENRMRAEGVTSDNEGVMEVSGANFCTREAIPGFTLVPTTGNGGLNLGPLLLNGDTPVHPLLANSVAIDAAVNSTIGVDQIGTRRPFGAANDAGAVEYWVNTPPTLIAVTGGAMECIPATGIPLAVTIGVIDANPDQSVILTLKQGDQTLSQRTVQPPVDTYISFEELVFLPGEHHLTIEATDGFDTSTSEVVLILGADAPPQFTSVPGNVSIETADPLGAVVTYEAAHAADACGPVTISHSLASGSLFPIGTTTVTCTATDAAGQQVTATFTVTVTHKAPPTIAEQINSLIGQVAALSADRNVTGSLAAQLSVAQAAHARNNAKIAAQHLVNFERSVERLAQKGQLTAQQSASLLQKAQAIRAALGH
ncbi:MAG TPA: right-handed parallel beta-helix repeat-containing protein [Methylomirabilota bacterium]|nr:right-handed parallel beta-helix repeat-containing protein [Methylomirabilota bacterium]